MSNLEIAIPFGGTPGQARCLNGGEVSAEYDKSAGLLMLRLDRLDFFEAIRVETP
jgi:hypothetical protein